MFKNSNMLLFLNRRLGSLRSANVWLSTVTSRSYCYKNRKNPFQQWDDFIEPSDAKIVEKFESNSKTNQLLKKQEEHMLSNLGLEKYVELFEENLKAMKKYPTDAEEKEGEELKYFEKFLDQREFKDHSVEEFTRLIDSEETRERIKQILKDYELEKYDTSQVPTSLNEDMMRDLLLCEKTFDVIKHLNFLFRREARKFSYKSRNEIERIKTQERLRLKFLHSAQRTGLEFRETGAPVYSKWKNTMFISFNRGALRKESQRRQRDAVLFGPKLMLDFGYGDVVYKKQSFSTLNTQLFFSLNEITNAKIPFHITFCNLGDDHPMGSYLKENIAQNDQDNFLCDFTSKSYLDLFPKEKLIYLSADAPRSLDRVDPDKVYILGAFTDKYCPSDYSYQKAKREGIQVCKLPLDDYFFFRQDRVLPINLVIGILERYLEFNDWRKAMIGKVPLRKLKTPEDLRLEQIRKVRKFYSKEKFFKVYKIGDTPNENSPGFQPNIFKSNAKNEAPTRSPRFYTPKFTPKYRIKYTPDYRDNSSEKISINHYRPNADKDSNDRNN